MLNRDSLAGGAFLNSFKEALGDEWWSEERIEASMQDMLARRPPNEPVWVFAYGSLIWNPVFHFVESCPAVLDGWRRSFCIRLLAGRGSPEQPGRMMSLAAGGCTQGLALRLDEYTLEPELRMVWRREMVGGAYLPAWAPVRLEDGRSVQAIIFTANPGSAMHEADDTVATVAPLIATAHGLLGSNREYVRLLDAALRHYDIKDAYIQDLAEQLELVTDH
ncbi:MAG: gamma-glutamylcyclotransferase [Alcaligenaceae bacterium]|nr:gamma-glutamylcyclotransferase [Alcaligenaceae bacterium]